MQNKIILLTGATDGIGKRTALRLAEKGTTLLMHGKDSKKGNKIKEEIITRTKNQNVFYFNADFCSFDEINELSNAIHQRFSQIDILINNAGIYEKEKIILKNGIEKTFMVNYLAPFFLSLQLLDLLKISGNARILNVSSMIHASSIDFENLNGEKQYSGEEAYSLSKLCNVLFTYKLSSLLDKENISVNTLHPGVINTKLLKAAWGAFGSTTEEGAKRILYLTYADTIQNNSGGYYMNDVKTKSSPISYDKEVQNKLWDISLKWANIK